MGKTMKRLLWMTIVCLLLGSIGCESEGGFGKETEGITNETVRLPESTQNIVEELPHVEITLGLVAEPYNHESTTTPEFASQAEEVLSLLNQKAMDDGLNITVRIMWLPSTYNPDMAALGEYDECDAWYVRLSDVPELSEAGYIMPLNNMIKKHGPSYYQFLMDNPYVLKGMGIKDFENESVFLLPTDRVGTDANVVLMDRQIADKYDLSISNLNEYIEAMRTIKAGGEPKFPSLFVVFDFLDEYMGQYGYYDYYSLFFYTNINDPVPVVYPAVEIDEYKKMLLLLQELYTEKLVGSYGDLYTSLSIGEAYSIITYPSLFLTTKNTLRKNKEYTVFPLLGRDCMYSVGSGLAINKNSQELERIMMLINRMYSDPEYMEIWLYGGGLADGKNKWYALDDKGRITYKKLKDPMYDWLNIAGETFFSMDLARIPHYLPEDFVEIYTEILNSCIPERERPHLDDSIEKGTEEYEELQKLRDECYQYYDYLQALLGFRDNPNYDVDKVLRALEDAKIKETAQKLTDFFQNR